jgi:hypothetical protein
MAIAAWWYEYISIKRRKKARKMRTVLDLRALLRCELAPTPARGATRPRNGRTVVHDELALGGVVRVDDIRDCGIVVLRALHDRLRLGARGVDEPAVHQFDARLLE